MIARVIIDRSSNQLDKPFDYLIPSDLHIEKGDRVLVPFGKTNETGFVVDFAEKSDGKFELKEILQVMDEFPAFTENALDLMEFMRKRFFLKYVDVLRTFIPSALRTDKVRDLERFYVSLIDGADVSKIKAEKQLEAIKLLKEDGEKSFAELSMLVGAAPINALEKKGIVSKYNKRVERKPLKELSGVKKSVDLTDDQNKAIKTIFETKKDTILLHGVTGSGKTEVYMEVINRILAEGKTAIMLVPEISLTPQTMNRFRGIFGDNVALLHSGLSDGERCDEWKKLRLGQAKIAIGARSAIFAPLTNVGVIVIDEEHDSSYNSESNPRFKTLEIARYIAKQNNAKVILGSATPSIESYKKARDGEYELARMPKRITDKGMPKISIIDMKQEVLRGNNSMFSLRLQNELETTFKKGEQAMILINRLGYSSYIRCTKCGYVPKCPNCDVALTYHKLENKLICHYCGTKVPMTNTCPSCGAHELKFGKMGTETVVEELNKLYPDIKVLKLDSDTKSKKDGPAKVLSDFANNKAQVLVGTQMIAKGHDFSNVTLVGLVDADLGLYQQDFRSNERTFQLVTQMSGRAGRADKEGRVILQTYSPNSYVYKFATSYNYDEFYRKEVNIRETTSFPPFVSIVRVLVSHLKREKARDGAGKIYFAVRDLKAKNPNILTYAGMEAPMSKMNSLYRFQIVMRISKDNEIETLGSIYEIINKMDKKDLIIFVEQDPQSMM